jgi:low temperature requirement protein LtrA
MKPTLFLRGAAAVTLLLGVGHLVGRPWTPSKDPLAAAVVVAMKSHQMDVMGFNRTFMDFYLGFGLMLGVFLLAQGVLLWMLADLANSDPVRARRMVAVFLIINLLQTALAAAYLFTVPLVMSAAVTLCLGVAIAIPAPSVRQRA